MPTTQCRRIVAGIAVMGHDVGMSETLDQPRRGVIFRWLAADHDRLDGLLQQAMQLSAAVDRAAYDEFRAGLLKHIAMEEKVLLPAAQRANRNVTLAVAVKLRAEQGAIAALLVPSPTFEILRLLQDILRQHNPLEEEAEALYDTCDELLGAGAPALVEQLRQQPEVRVAPNNDGPLVLPATRRALERAGFRAEAARL